MTRPTPEQFETAAAVLAWMEATPEVIDPDDLGHAGHFAWLCRTWAERGRS